jgi:hypothetical protein
MLVQNKVQVRSQRCHVRSQRCHVRSQRCHVRSQNKSRISQNGRVSQNKSRISQNSRVSQNKSRISQNSRVSTVFSCDHLFCFTIASIHNRVLLCALEGSGRPGVSFLTILFCHLYIIVKEDFWDGLEFGFRIGG